MNFAGLPPHISLSGISLVTIEPAPTIELSPIDILAYHRICPYETGMPDFDLSSNKCESFLWQFWRKVMRKYDNSCSQSCPVSYFYTIRIEMVQPHIFSDK